MILNMEGLGGRGVALDSLDAVRNIQEKHLVLLGKLVNLFNQAKADGSER